MRVTFDNSSLVVPGSNPGAEAQVIPSTYTKIASMSDSTMEYPAEASTFYVTYQARIASTQPAGTYTGKVKYVLVHPSTAVAPVDNVIFIAGENIEYITVSAVNSDYFGYAKHNQSLSVPINDTQYVVTVMPNPGAILQSWTSDRNTGRLANSDLLTTIYTPQANNGGGETLTATGALGSSYQSMQYTGAPFMYNCGETKNLTDTRNNRSYTVLRMGNYCYMASPLMLEGGTTLSSDTSNVDASYTLPTSTANTTKLAATMFHISGTPFYTYNWLAVTANPHTYSGVVLPAQYPIDGNGDICPKGWHLPTYEDLTPTAIWNNGTNPGMLSTLNAYNAYGSIGEKTAYWSNSGINEGGIYNNAYALYFSANSGATRIPFALQNTLQVRCVAKATL